MEDVMALFPLRKLTVPLLGLTLALGGCAGSAGQYDKVVELAPENSLLRFYGKAQTGIQPLRVAFADPWEYEEYAGFRGQEMRLEVFYVTKARVQTAVQYPYALRNMVGTWNHNAGKSISWGESGDVYNPISRIGYQRYTLAGNASCAGFQTEWDYPADDPDNRPGQVMFGYLCAAPGLKLSDAAIDDTLANIGIRGISERIRRNDPKQLASNFGERSQLSASSRSAALAIAKGSSTSASGNVNFPFEFVVTYSVTGGDLTN
jgi:hypothetical protein